MVRHMLLLFVSCGLQYLFRSTARLMLFVVAESDFTLRLPLELFTFDLLRATTRFMRGVVTEADLRLCFPFQFLSGYLKNNSELCHFTER